MRRLRTLLLAFMLAGTVLPVMAAPTLALPDNCADTGGNDQQFAGNWIFNNNTGVRSVRAWIAPKASHLRPCGDLSSEVTSGPAGDGGAAWIGLQPKFGGSFPPFDEFKILQVGVINCRLPALPVCDNVNEPHWFWAYGGCGAQPQAIDLGAPPQVYGGYHYFITYGVSPGLPHYRIQIVGAGGSPTYVNFTIALSDPRISCWAGTSGAENYATITGETADDGDSLGTAGSDRETLLSGIKYELLGDAIPSLWRSPNWSSGACDMDHTSLYDPSNVLTGFHECSRGSDWIKVWTTR